MPSLCQRDGTGAFESSSSTARSWLACTSGNDIPISMMKAHSCPEVKPRGKLPRLTASTTMPRNDAMHSIFGDMENMKTPSRARAQHKAKAAWAGASVVDSQPPLGVMSA